ncbi:hypothetical protein DXN05_23625 [Deminuibacter soli]|uniref:Uncharacterized protein n=2 Tax=Deminuibacter soli TaxID=2291815 RepID=A0A3E1NCL7_9BACT|nr:hypothetical protein DXN05_23625 [Deminuibacter soli]
MMIVLLSLALVTGASAQRGGHFSGGYHGGGFVGPRTTVVVGAGYYSPFYSPWGFYYGYPLYPYGEAYHRPTRLDIQVSDIKNDYADKISSVKLDNTLSGKERRQKVRQLRRERDETILQARKDYYKS